MTESRPAVLVCDDEAMLRELIRASLGGGYRVLEAASVGEAEEALGERVPEVVLVDLMLPGGSGLDVLRSLRRRDPQHRTAAVVVSAWTTDEYRDAADEAGADAFLAKPFLPEELAALVARLVETR